MNRITAFAALLIAIVLASLVLQACNALNPACGSARPVPGISSLSDTTVNFSDVQQGFVLVVNGSHFVSSTVGVVNGLSLSTLVTSSTQLQVTIDTSVISAPGAASVEAFTPAGNTGHLGCDSGGTSAALTLTVN